MNEQNRFAELRNLALNQITQLSIAIAIRAILDRAGRFLMIKIKNIGMECNDER